MTDQATTAGATPVAAGATPAQTPAQAGNPTSTSSSSAPATGAADDQALGTAGLAALEQERQARKAAERSAKTLQEQLDALKASQLSDTEKAIVEARKQGVSEATGKLHSQLRTTEVKSGLIAAGVIPSLAGLAAKDDSFSALTVSDAGEVEGLADALGAFRKTHPDLFGKAGAAPTGSFDTGTGGGRQAGKPTYTREQLRDVKFFQDNKADILLAQREGRIQA